MNPVLAYTDSSILFISLTLQLFNLVWFQFLLSCFLENSSTAPAVACVVHFLSFIPWGPMMENYSDLSYLLKCLTTFIPTLSIGHFWLNIANWEGNGSGNTWANLMIPLSSDDFSLGGYWCLTGINILICMFACWYIEQISPGEFGVAKKWNFIFTELFTNKPNQNSGNNKHQNIARQNPENFEALPVHTKPSVQIKGLTKKFTTIDGEKNSG